MKKYLSSFVNETYKTVSNNKLNIIKMFVFGFVGFSILTILSTKSYVYSVFHGFLAAAAYIVIKILQNNKRYHKHANNSVTWVKRAILLGVLPLVFWFLMLFVLGPDQVNRLLWYHPYLGGPILILGLFIQAFFPLFVQSILTVTLWWMAPLVIGFTYSIIKGRR